MIATAVVAVAVVVAVLIEVVTRRQAEVAREVIALSDRWRDDFAGLIVDVTEQFRRQAHDAAAQHRDERDVLMRAVMSRHASDFTHLERSGASAHRTVAESARPVMTAEEYASWVKDDLAKLGVDDDQVAPILEGL